MPLVEISEELKVFLEEISSREFNAPDDIFRFSKSLKKIKGYIDSHGIELKVYQKPFGPLLSDEEKELLEKETLRLSFLSLKIVSGDQLRKIILVPGKILELLIEDKKKWLPELIDALLHELSHLEELTENQEEGEIVIKECSFSETSCLYEEILTAIKSWKFREILRIRKRRKPFLRHFLKGIFSPIHLNCFEALEKNACPLQDLIEKDKYYKNYVRPLWEQGKNLTNT